MYYHTYLIHRLEILLPLYDELYITLHMQFLSSILVLRAIPCPSVV